MSLIQLDQVSKTYGNGVVALQSTTLSIEAGTFNVILGPSGAGKSTLLRMINGLETTTTGHVSIQGQRLTTHNLRRMRSRMAWYFSSST